MKRKWQLLFLLLPLLAAAQSPLSSERPKSTTAEASQSVQHVLQAQVEAWNRHDLEGFMAGYWNSPDLTFFSGGDMTKGWQPALDRYKKRYTGEGREMGTLDFTELEIKVLSPESAVVTGKWRLTLSDGKKPGGLFTLLFRKIQGEWKIVHDHTSAG
jgi:ketosteroid isomerase-like protein